MKTVVLGGYGNFGARICRALAADSGIALLVAGRDAQRATALADSLGGGARGVRLDVQSGDLAATLRELGVDLVIHTAGPFQSQDYRVPQAVAAGRLAFAHADWSGYSIFEEAFTRGHVAGNEAARE